MNGTIRGLPRRLGIGVVPVQGESFPSWVDRMAVRMRTGPGWVIRELGVDLQPGGHGIVLPSNYGISMSRRSLDAVQAATGVAPAATNAMLLSVYDGTVLDLSSLGRGPPADRWDNGNGGCSAGHGAAQIASRRQAGRGGYGGGSVGLRLARNIRCCSTASALDAACRCGGVTTSS